MDKGRRFSGASTWNQDRNPLSPPRLKKESVLVHILLLLLRKQTEIRRDATAVMSVFSHMDKPGQQAFFAGDKDVTATDLLETRVGFLKADENRGPRLASQTRGTVNRRHVSQRSEWRGANDKPEVSLFWLPTGLMGAEIKSRSLSADPDSYCHRGERSDGSGSSPGFFTDVIGP